MAAANLKGSIDVVRVGRDFLNIEGWVCQADKKQAEIPIVFSCGGSQFSGFGLNMRADLAAAGIAGGVAGFNILIPHPPDRLAENLSLAVTDLSGAKHTLTAAKEVVKPFTPAGAIDRVTAQTVSGWIFNPAAGKGASHAQLFFEDEYLCGVIPGLERIELDFDLGDGMKVFGFEVPSESLRDAMRLHASRFRGRNGRLSLVASGMCLSTAEVRWSDENLLMVGVQSFHTIKQKLPASDHLASRWFG